MQKNLLGEVSLRKFPKIVLNFPKRNHDADPNISEVAGVQVPIRVYRCWNWDEIGHGWDMCLKERKVFCYDSRAKNIYKPQCPGCLVIKSENRAKIHL